MHIFYKQPQLLWFLHVCHSHVISRRQQFTPFLPILQLSFVSICLFGFFNCEDGKENLWFLQSHWGSSPAQFFHYIFSLLPYKFFVLKFWFGGGAFGIVYPYMLEGCKVVCHQIWSLLLREDHTLHQAWTAAIFSKFINWMTISLLCSSFYANVTSIISHRVCFCYMCCLYHP